MLEQEALAQQTGRIILDPAQHLLDCLAILGIHPRCAPSGLRTLGHPRLISEQVGEPGGLRIRHRCIGTRHNRFAARRLARPGVRGLLSPATGAAVLLPCLLRLLCLLFLLLRRVALRVGRWRRMITLRLRGGGFLWLRLLLPIAGIFTAALLLRCPLALRRLRVCLLPLVRRAVWILLGRGLPTLLPGRRSLRIRLFRTLLFVAWILPVGLGLRPRSTAGLLLLPGLRPLGLGLL